MCNKETMSKAYDIFTNDGDEIDLELEKLDLIVEKKQELSIKLR